MRVLLQRVSEARVVVDGAVTGEIARGLLVFVGLGHGDSEALLDPFIDKLLNLRIFADAEGQMNLSVKDIGGGVLAVSQFTLLADARKGRRPSYTDALPPAEARALYEKFVQRLQLLHMGHVAAGIFAADMKVSLVNDGPVTIWLDSTDMPWGRPSGAGKAPGQSSS